MRVARDYGCLIEDKGITFRASYLIDPKGVLRQITMNDLPVGRSVDEALRLVQAFQFTVSGFLCCTAPMGADEIRRDARMNMVKCVLRIGRKVGKRSGRILLRNLSTLLLLIVATKRTARQAGPNAPAPTNLLDKTFALLRE